MYRDLAPILAAGAIGLLLCATLCLPDGDGGVDLCLLMLAVASTALVALALELAGGMSPVVVAAPDLTPADIRPPPPKR